MIHLTDVLALIREGDKPFSIKFVSCDLKKDTGGEIIDLDNAVRTKLPYDSKQRVGIKQLNNGHHPFPVHQKLILEFNAEKVFW